MKPILFNTPMVQAILSGAKTTTRRLVKGYALEHLELDTDGSIVGIYCQDEGHVYPISNFMPYQPGGVLYVRETWCEFPKSKYHFKADYETNRDEEFFQAVSDAKWHPSIHMPKGAARLFIRVTGVRAERLQDITNAGALAEGCDGRGLGPSSGCDGSLSVAPYDFSIEKFETVWDSTVKKSDIDRYGWAANPWVWVYTFERCEKEA